MDLPIFWQANRHARSRTIREILINTLGLDLRGEMAAGERHRELHDIWSNYPFELREFAVWLSTTTALEPLCITSLNQDAVVDRSPIGRAAAVAIHSGKMNVER